MENQKVDGELIYANKRYICMLDFAMDLIGSKWKTKVIYHLKDGALRSGELEKILSGISNKMFVQTLRELEKDDLVERIVYHQVPPRVEYRLRPNGQSLLPFLQELIIWGRSVAEQNISSYEDTVQNSSSSKLEP